MKKLILSVTALLTAAALTACGGQTSEEKAEGTADGTTVVKVGVV